MRIVSILFVVLILNACLTDSNHLLEDISEKVEEYKYTHGFYPRLKTSREIIDLLGLNGNEFYPEYFSYSLDEGEQFYTLKWYNEDTVSAIFNSLDRKVNYANITDNSNPSEQMKEFQFADTSFYKKFSSDIIFQLKRVKFPLKGKYQGYDDERLWSESNWPNMKFDINEVLNNPDDSVSVIQNDRRFFLGTYCKGCGFSFEMEFNKFKSGWFLTYRQENNF